MPPPTTPSRREGCRQSTVVEDRDVNLPQWIRRVFASDVAPVVEAEAAAVAEAAVMRGFARGVADAIERVTGRRPMLAAPVEPPAIEGPEPVKRGRRKSA